VTISIIIFRICGQQKRTICMKSASRDRNTRVLDMMQWNFENIRISLINGSPAHLHYIGNERAWCYAVDRYEWYASGGNEHPSVCQSLLSLRSCRCCLRRAPSLCCRRSSSRRRCRRRRIPLPLSLSTASDERENARGAENPFKALTRPTDRSVSR